jgi:hypothetical protein
MKTEPVRTGRPEGVTAVVGLTFLSIALLVMLVA